MSTDIEELNNNTIKNKIYTVRNKQVILDYDLGEIFEIETKRINEAVKRNPLKFPIEYCFQLTKDEINDLSLKSQFATLNKNNNLRGQHFKYLPYAFTEYGITMLATILKSEKAIKTSINIVNEFVNMRKIILSSNDLYKQLYFIENKLINHEEDIKIIKDSFNKLKEKELKDKIFFKGQTYDSHSFLLDILNLAKKEIIIIDNYTDKKILDLISKTNKKVLVLSKNMNDELIKKYQSQYDNLTIKESNEFHDRFIIIDRKILYSCGLSFKDLGKGCFTINKIEDEEILNCLLNKI